MQFELTEEQQQIKMSVREFAESEIAPHVMEWDESQHFPVELQPKLAELGLMGVIFPEEYGGAGMGYVEYATIIEELSRVDGSVGISVAAHNSLCSNHIYKHGSEEQRQKYLVPLATGKHLGAWGLTEPSAGSDASGTKSTAVRSDGGWIVNGSKNFITHAIHGDTCVAMAVTDKSKRSKGISAFIFEKGMKGFSPSKKENKLGLRASETASVVFEDCLVSNGQLLGEEGMGFVNSMEILDGGRISVAAMGVGLAQGAYDLAFAYAQDREQFGKPIASFQAIRFKLADMATEIEAGRALVLKAAWLKDQGRPFAREAAMAKLYTGELSNRVANAALQIHGGFGYMEESAVSRLYRDQKILEIGEGTNEVQRMVIARHLGL